MDGEGIEGRDDIDGKVDYEVKEGVWKG